MLLIGNGGDTPNGSGGMIPSTAPPFAMTRWVAQTHQNYVSVTPYNWTADTIHGFQGTRQPAIWMGESGPVTIIPGVSRESNAGVKANFEERGLRMKGETERISPALYEISLDDGEGGEIHVEQSATSRVGHLRFTFTNDEKTTPYLLLESSRPSVITSTPTNITYPHGTISFSLDSNGSVHEICGSNSERQDWIIEPTSTAPYSASFAGYYCARFSSSTPATSFGTIQNGTNTPKAIDGSGSLLSGYALFSSKSHERSAVQIEVRIGTSFISVEQARHNIDSEIPDGTTLEETVQRTKKEWTDKLDMFFVEGADEVQTEVFYTGSSISSPALDLTLTPSKINSIPTSKTNLGPTTPATMEKFTEANRIL
ncbi:hypothetical protein H0H93_006894, partial [Arthromyces matolae]